MLSDISLLITSCPYQLASLERGEYVQQRFSPREESKAASFRWSRATTTRSRACSRRSAIDGILVGDSAAMVMHGHPSTLSASVELMRLHTEAVVARRGRKSSSSPTCRFCPFGRVCAAALDAAHVLMTAGAHAVKLEGVDGHEDVIQRLVAERDTRHGPSRPAAAIGSRLRRLSRPGPKRRLGAGYRPPGARARRAGRVRDRAGVRSGEPGAGDHRGRCGFRPSASAPARDATDRSSCCRICWA